MVCWRPIAVPKGGANGASALGRLKYYEFRGRAKNKNICTDSEI